MVIPGQGATVGGSQGWYGDGSNGSGTLDGTTTVFGLVPAASLYTMARDLYCTNLTINNGVSLKTNGYRLFCSGTLTNNGTILWVGLNATTNASAGNLVNNSASINAGNIGAAGGAGGTTGNGNPGGSQGTNCSAGGAGGTGGNAGASSGGAGGQNTGFNAGIMAPRALPHFLGPYGQQGQTLFQCFGGSGGGGGAGASGVSGGAGGTGGGIVLVVAFTIAGTGTISVRGGNGANAPGANSGGGGGGGGGSIFILSSSASGGAVAGQTLVTAGGTHGNGTGTGTNGVDGSAGPTFVLQG